MAHSFSDSHKHQYSLQVGNRGRIVLPAELRKRLEIQEGDQLILTLETDGSLRLTSAWELAHKGLGLFAHVAPEVSLVDDLIAERKAEAARE
ncbi:hypothetical protein BH24DEI1_BH24DEI1_02390 [soil metagenome]|jgi:AbrB family looped-hinge helix DNA binding protein